MVTKKELTQKQIDTFHAKVIACLPPLTKEKILYYSKKTSSLKMKLSGLSVTPEEQVRIQQGIAQIANQEIEDINNFVGN